MSLKLNILDFAAVYLARHIILLLLACIVRFFLSLFYFIYFIFFKTSYGISPENIILYGQSIGTVPTVDLASRYECAAVVLHSPLTSGMRVAFPDTKKTYCFDAFPK